MMSMPSSALRRTQKILAMAGAVMLVTTSAWAVEKNSPTVPLGNLVIEPVLVQYGSYSTNPTLLLSNPQELYGSITTPELIVSDVTPTTQMILDNEITENVFNLQGYSSTDLHSKDSITTETERWKLGLTGKADYDTTRTSELTSFGLTVLPVRHSQFSAAPQISYALNQTDKATLEGSAVLSTYATTAFTDYEKFTVTPGYAHAFNERNTGIFNVAVQEYRAIKGSHNTTKTISPSLGWVGILTPELKINANFGMQESKQDKAGITSNSWNTNYTFTGDLTYEGEQDKLDLVANRSQYPFGNGTEALLTHFGATDTHDVNDRVSLNAGLDYELADYPTVATGNLKSLATATGGLTYHMTRHFDILGTYQFRYENLVDINQHIDDHTVYIGFAYHPKGWTL